jgi:glutathione S-transferase
MTDDLTLYTNPRSRGRIARWMLEESGASYDTVVLDYGTAMVAPAYRAINPMMMPAIVHRGQVVTETAAICAYLADAFPDAGLRHSRRSVPIIIAGCSSRRARWRRRSPTARWA